MEWCRAVLRSLRRPVRHAAVRGSLLLTPGVFRHASTRIMFGGSKAKRLTVVPFAAGRPLIDCSHESKFPNSSWTLRKARALRTAASIFIRLRMISGSIRRDPHGSVKPIHHEELEDRDKERPSAFPKIMLKQTDSSIQQLHGAGERTQDQQRRRRLLVDYPQYEQSQRNSGRRRVHRQ